MPALNEPRLALTSHSMLCLILSSALIGMMGSAFSFLHISGDARWIILILLFLFFVILKKHFLRFFEAKFAFFLFTYLTWCLFSFCWSDLPQLSFLKGGIFLITTITMIRAGIEWVKINSIDKALDYLWLLALISLLSGFLGKFSQTSTIVNINSTTYYQGLANGSNMFGTLMAMTLPYFLWKGYYFWPHHKLRSFIFFACVAISLNFLVLSFSRSAMLMGMYVLTGFLFSLNMNKKVSFLLLGLLLLLSLSVIFPTVILDALESTKKLAFKGYSSNIFHSREAVWDRSYEGAQEGGLIGLGYGVTAGKTDLSFENGLTPYGYSLEKGNSQLAIIEETGIIGFFLYLCIFFLLTGKLLIMYLKTPERNHKILIGITGGAFFGMIGHSVFEAWWTSPGSQESIYFWMLVGIILGLEKAIKCSGGAYNKI